MGETARQGITGFQSRFWQCQKSLVVLCNCSRPLGRPLAIQANSSLNNWNPRLLSVVITCWAKLNSLAFILGLFTGKKGDKFMGRTYGESTGVSRWWWNWCVDVHVYVLYMYVCVHMCMLVFRGQMSTWRVFLSHSSSYFLRKGLSLVWNLPVG